MKRPLKIYQLAPREMQTMFAIVPFGRYLNQKLLNAKSGDLVEFCVDWRRDKFVLIRRAQIAVNTSAFNFLLKAIHGEDATWHKLSERWRAKCIVEGLGEDAFDRENVLLLSLKPYVKEEYEAELERLRLAEEKERIRQEVLAGTFWHKDVIY